MKTTFLRSSVVLIFAAAAARLLGTVSPASGDVVMRAMRDELARSVTQLQMENLPKPYFISYHIQQHRNQGTAAEFGSTTSQFDAKNRRLVVQVRVGTPALDNTNFQAGFGSTMTDVLGSPLSVDDDYAVLRRQIWLATDRAYKSAVEQLSRKKAALENKNRTDDTPDFSAQPPANLADVTPGAPIDLEVAGTLARELSAVFRELPGVATSAVRISSEDESTWYVNSEGSSFVREVGGVSLVASAGTQAADGAPINDAYEVFRRRWSELPAKSELVAAIRGLGLEVTNGREAAMIDPYNGPVLFEGQAAAELFGQVFAVHLVGRKPAVVDSSLPAGFGAEPENPFLDKLGARVLPDFLSVTDDPTATSVGGVPVVTATKVDDEGVPTAAVRLIENGRLKTLLVSRAPVRGVLASTGSLHGTTPLPTTLVVASSEGRDAAALKAELLKNVQQRNKPYGVIVRRIVGGGQAQAVIMSALRGNARVVNTVVAVKVFPDGHEEPLRNVQVAGLDATGFKDILASGSQPYVTVVPFRVAPIGGSNVVSIAVPSLLFEDVTLKKPAGQLTKPPIAKHPYFEKM